MRRRSDSLQPPALRPTSRAPGRVGGHWLLLLLLGVVLATAAPTCAPDLTEDEFLDEQPGVTDEATQAGLERLAAHDLHGAMDQFELATERSRRATEARVGLGLVRLLLLPEHPAAERLITLTGGQPIDMQADVYGDDGLLAMMAARVDQVRIEDRQDEILPWSAADLDDPWRPIGRMDPALELNVVADALVPVATELTEAAAEFERALDNPRSLTVLQLPQGSFHGQTFFGLRRSEVHLMTGIAQLGASTLLWLSAYDWDLNAGMLGPEVPLEQRVEALNQGAFRALRAPGRLFLARGLLESALDHLSSAIEEGFLADTPGSLAWSALSAEQAAGLVTLLADLSASIDDPRLLRDAPEVRAHLGLLFAGRLMPEGANLLQLAQGEDGDEVARLDHGGIRALLIDEVITPGCSTDPERDDPECPPVFTEGHGAPDTWLQVVEPFLNSLSEDYDL